MIEIKATALTSKLFVPFGDVIDFDREPDFAINNGFCDRYHGLAIADVIGNGGETGISLGFGRPYEVPLKLNMVERHPLGSQAFIPLEQQPFLVIVAEDDNGTPKQPVAFLSEGGQGVNYHRNVWHGVLTPLNNASKFLIVDRIGEGNNLEEYFFDEPYLVTI
ncbi:MAG: ureidoglycolate lyase [Rhizobiaceae bacterium]|nr:ureidoglycolate lyase [Rhizobiaceae bacterium]